MKSVSWLWAAALGLAVGVVVPALAQLVPPLHVPTHEFSTAFTLVSAAVAYGSGAWWARRDAARRASLAPLASQRAAMARVAVALMSMGPAAWATIALLDGLACGCRIQLGAAYFWLTWTPLALLSGVLGSALGARGWRLRSLLLVVLAVVSVDLMHDSVQALLGFRVVDLLVGKPMAFDQRAELLPIPLVHIYQRLFVLALALVAWWWSAWRSVARQAASDRALRPEASARAVPALLGAVALGIVASARGSELGLGWGHGALHSALSQELRTEHFVIRYPPAGRAALEIHAVAAEAEWSWRRYQRDWGIDPASPLRLYVFDDRDQLQALTDTAATHVVFRRIYAPWWISTGSTMHHELAHALHIELAPSPSVVLSRGILEGLAEAYENDYALFPEAHEPLAGALASGELPHAWELMHPLGFFRVHEGNAYDASGSFIGWLVLEHGFEALLELQRSHTLDFEAAYGLDLHQLDADWRRFLATVPVDMEAMVQAQDSFDPSLWPSYTDQCCPKLGREEPTPVELAEQLWKAESWSRARGVYRELWEREGKARQAFQAAQCEWAMGQPAAGLALIEQALDSPSLAPAEAFRLHQGRLGLLLDLGRLGELGKALDARDSVDPHPSRDRRIIARLLRDPALQEPVAQALVAWDPARQRGLLQALLEEHPEREELRYLYATRVYAELGARYGLGVRMHERDRALEAIAFASTAPGAVDPVADELLSLVDKAVRAGDLELAERLVEGALDSAEKPLVRRRFELRRERIAWERGR